MVRPEAALEIAKKDVVLFIRVSQVAPEQVCKVISSREPEAFCA